MFANSDNLGEPLPSQQVIYYNQTIAYAKDITNLEVKCLITVEDKDKSTQLVPQSLH